MKKLIYLALLLTACQRKNHDGTYVNHSEGQFSIADDTLIISDTVVWNRTGYQKIRDGQTLPKATKVRKWTLNSPDAPVMQIKADEIIVGSTVYHKLP
jgi:hypothetical protein